jgi:hypothetical protein
VAERELRLAEALAQVLGRAEARVLQLAQEAEQGAARAPQSARAAVPVPAREPRSGQALLRAPESAQPLAPGSAAPA